MFSLRLCFVEDLWSVFLSPWHHKVLRPLSPLSLCFPSVCPEPFGWLTLWPMQAHTHPLTVWPLWENHKALSAFIIMLMELEKRWVVVNWKTGAWAVRDGCLCFNAFGSSYGEERQCNKEMTAYYLARTVVFTAQLLSAPIMKICADCGHCKNLDIYQFSCPKMTIFLLSF